MARYTGVTPFAMSRTRETIPGSQPAAFHAFAAPGLPSPTALTSLLSASFPTITDHGMDPLINPTVIQIRISNKELEIRLRSSSQIILDDLVSFRKFTWYFLCCNSRYDDTVVSMFPIHGGSHLEISSQLQ